MNGWDRARGPDPGASHGRRRRTAAITKARARPGRMPLYEYECDGCGHRGLRTHPQVLGCRRSRSAPSVTAPSARLLSPPAIQFKGTGWYVTDYARKSGGGTARPRAPARPARTRSRRTGRAGRPRRQVRGRLEVRLGEQGVRGERLVRLGRRLETGRLGRIVSVVPRVPHPGRGWRRQTRRRLRVLPQPHRPRSLHRSAHAVAFCGASSWSEMGRRRQAGSGADVLLASVDSQPPATPRAEPSAASITGARSGRLSAKWIVASR